jgi:CheY-like chemotaxis protein
MPMSAHILVVDDDPQIVCLLRASVEQAGYAVSVAGDGKQTLTLARHITKTRIMTASSRTHARVKGGRLHLLGAG